MGNELIGQAVQFKAGSSRGHGIITNYLKDIAQFEIRYCHRSAEWPYTGKLIVSTVRVYEEEMIKVYPVKIDKFWVIGTNYIVYNVYEPSIPVRAGAFYGHSTITHVEVDGKIQVYGRIGTNDLTPEINALPAMTDDRSTAVRAFMQTHCDRAVNLIYAKYLDHLSTTTNRLRIESGEIEECFPNRDEAKAWGRSEE